MTNEEIIRMARNEYGIYAFTAESLADFARLAAAAEREACAKMFDGPVFSYDYREIAAAIRARGEK